ncbi:MAG: iron ABC transporter permease, partial [Rhodospirillales bacterium]
MNRTVALWTVAGWIGLLVLPWYVIEDGFWGFSWLVDGWPMDPDYGPAWVQILDDGKIWLAPLFLFLLAPLATWGRHKADPGYASILLVAGGGGFFYCLLQGFTIGIAGWEYQTLETLFGPLGDRQFGMGYG